MKRFIKSKKGLALLAALVVAVAASIGAYAYFTSTGTGTGHATVGSDTNFTVTPTDVSALNKLYPGGPSYAVDGKVVNTSAGNQQLNTITATIKDPSGAGSAYNGCTAADFALSASSGWVVAVNGLSATLTVNQDLAPNTGEYDWSGLSLGMVDRQDAVAGDGSGNQDDCRGTTANVQFDAS